MDTTRQIQQRLDRLYSELAVLKRYVLLHLPGDHTQNRQAWSDLIDASKAVSAQWAGPSAVEEIRAQREK